MKWVIALGIFLFTTSTSLADANASRFRIENGKVVIAQSACGICDNNRTSCVLACNGGGACIQVCGDQYRDCARENCRRR
jgi:hypothetical protein